MRPRFSYRCRKPALGTYRVTRNPSGLGNLEIAAVGGNLVEIVLVITRLAQDVPAAREARAALVFEKVKERHFLSEVWMAGQDGYLVRGTPEEHEHVIVRPVG